MEKANVYVGVTRRHPFRIERKGWPTIYLDHYPYDGRGEWGTLLMPNAWYVMGMRSVARVKRLTLNQGVN